MIISVMKVAPVMPVAMMIVMVMLYVLFKKKKFFFELDNYVAVGKDFAKDNNVDAFL